MWQYDDAKAEKAAGLQRALRQGQYKECYENVMIDETIADYLPPAFFRELATHLHAQDEWPAQYLLEFMSLNYPTSRKVASWLPKREDRGV